MDEFAGFGVALAGVEHLFVVPGIDGGNLDGGDDVAVGAGFGACGVVGDDTEFFGRVGDGVFEKSERGVDGLAGAQEAFGFA